MIQRNLSGTFLCLLTLAAFPGRSAQASQTHYVISMAPEAAYDVYQDSRLIYEGLFSTPGGALVFTAEGDGRFRIQPHGTGDPIPPGPVVDLSGSPLGPSAIALRWTAPGDDGSEGQARVYDLRYASEPITPGTFGSATPVDGEPAPGPAGTEEAFSVGGLAPGELYYFALRTADEASNWSALSNVAAVRTEEASDTTAPAAVTDLAAGSATDSSLVLTWTAPGDDGSEGQARQYDLRYASSPITPGSFDGATPVDGEPSPGPAGTEEACTVGGLAAGELYYFALRTADEASNWSDLSNVVSAKTAAASDTTAPAAVADLACGSTSDTSAVLTWTAPGDDGNEGRARLYDLRYASSPITPGTFGDATPVSGEPAPGPAGTEETFSVEGLAAGEMYYFALRTADEASNWSDLSNVAPVRTTSGSDTTAPAAVTDLAAGSTTDTSAILTWTAPGDDGNEGQARLYELRYASSPITPGTFGDATPVSGEPAPGPAGTEEAYTVGGLAPEELYYFALRTADDASNWSALSNVAAVRTASAPDTTAPAAVTDLAAGSVTDTSAILTWTAPGDDGNEGQARLYDLRYASSPITPGSFDEATPVNGEPAPGPAGTEEACTVGGLAAEERYYFALRTADEASNWSALSNLASVQTASAPDTTAPAGVTDLTAAPAADSSAVLTWTAPGDDGAEGQARLYDLRYATSPITAETFDAATPVSGEPAPGPAGTEETCAVGGLPAGEMCYFALRTADEASNWSVLSNLAALVVPGPDEPVSDESPPAPIVDLRVVSQTDTSLTLVWTAVGDDSLAGRAAEYDIRVSESPFAAGAWESARQLEGEPAPAPAGAEETFAITGLLPARTYHVAVRVRDEAGHLSGPSNEAQGTTLPPANSDHVAPEAVTDLTAVAASHDEIVLAWTASGDDGVVGRAAVYDLRHASEPIPPDGWPDADPVPTAPPRLAGEAETLRVSGLPPRSPHYFALTVRDEAGNASGLSNILLAWTAPAPDTLPPAGVEGLVVTETTATSISLAWIAPRDVYPAGADADSIPAAYELRFADAALGPFAWDAAAEAPAPAPQPPGTPVAAVVEGLGPDREYRFAVCARDAAGNPGPISAVVSGRTQVAPPDPPPEDTTPPAAVTTLTGFAAEPGTIRLVWEAVGDDGAVGRAHRYEVRWSLSPALAESWSSSDSLAGAPVPAAAGTWESLDWPGREAGRTYYAALRVHDEAGNASPISNVASIVMPLPGDEAPPSPPTVPAVDFDDAGVALSWSPSPDIDVAGYRVLRRRADLSAPLVLAELVPGTSWLDPSAVAGVLYAYSLRAIDTSGNVSSPTGEVLALVPAEGGETGTLPLVRRVQHFDVLPLSPRDHAVRLQWQVEAGPDLAGVRLYREQLSAGAMDAGPQNAGRDGALETDAHSAASPGSGAPATFVCLSSELLRADGLVGFEDGPVPAAGCYRYWIEAVPVADSAATQWLPPLLVVVPEWGDRWIGVWPNPTAGSVRMLYTRLAAGPATLRLFDAAGRLLGRAERHDGTGRLIWEVPDLEELAPGRLLPGVLFLSLETPVTTHRARVVLVRSR